MSGGRWDLPADLREPAPVRAFDPGPIGAPDRPMPRALVGWPEGSVYRPRRPVLFGRVLPLRSASSEPPPKPSPKEEQELSEELEEALTPAPDTEPDTLRSPPSELPYSDRAPALPVTEAAERTKAKYGTARTERECPICHKRFRAYGPKEACDRKCGAQLRWQRAKARRTA